MLVLVLGKEIEAATKRTWGLDDVRALHHDAESASASAAQGPEEVGVLACVRGSVFSVRSHALEFDYPVDAESVYRGENGMAAGLDPASGHTDGG